MTLGKVRINRAPWVRTESEEIYQGPEDPAPDDLAGESQEKGFDGNLQVAVPGPARKPSSQKVHGTARLFHQFSIRVTTKRFSQSETNLALCRSRTCRHEQLLEYGDRRHSG
jgi:hypothetical protein